MAVRLQESLIKLLKTDTINSHSSGVGLTIASSDALSLSSASSKDLNITSGNNLYIKSAANKNVILSAGATATEVARASEKGNFVVGGDNQTQTTYRFYVTGKTGLAGTTANVGHLYLTGSNGSSSTGNTTQIVFGTPTTEHIAISANDNALVLNPTSSTTTNQIVLYLNQHSLFPSGISTQDNNTNATSATTGAIITKGGIGVGKNIFSTGRYTSNQAGARYIVNNNALNGWFGFSENGESFGIYDVTNSYYLIKNTTKTAGGGVSLGSASQHTTVLGNLTVDKNTTLKGSTTLNGSLTHVGKYFYQSGDATMKFYPQTNNDDGKGHGPESIAIQTCFDDQDGETSSYVTTYENRCNLLLQPRGGQVYIGENLLTVGDTNYSLIVNGKTCLSNNIAYANGASTNYDIIKFIAGTNDGAGIVIGGGGLAVFGSGESASNLVTAESLTGATETTYVTSDGAIQFITNCQTIANRVAVVLNGSREFYPSVTNTGKLGTATYNWSAVHARALTSAGTLGITSASAMTMTSGGAFSLSVTGTTTLTSSSTIYIGNTSESSIIFKVNDTARARFNTSGHFVPEATTTYNLGSSSLKWNNVYAGTTHGVHNGNIKGVVESTGSTYSPLFINTSGGAAVDTTEYTRRANKDFKIAITEGTTSALGYVRLDLGNATSSGTAGNKYGRLRLYNQDTTYSDILGNSVGSYGNLRVTGARGGYHGILFGDATSGMAIMSVDGSHQGLHNQAKSKWIIYHNGNGSICIGGSTVATNYPIVLNDATKQVGTFWSTGNIWGNHFYPNTDLTYNLGSTTYRYNTMYGHQLYLSGTTDATMTAASANPRITFAESTSTQPVHLIYTDYNNYRSPAGLKVIGGTEATPAWFEVEGSIYSGGNIYTIHPTGGETNISVAHGSSKYLMLWGNNSSGTRGLWDTTKGKVITVTDTASSFYGNADTASSLATALNLTGNQANTGVHWNPFTWTVSKSWSGTTGIYAIIDGENTFMGIFSVKFRTGADAVTLSANQVSWLGTSTTSPPTLTLTAEVGSSSTTYRLYLTAPGSHRTYRIYKISEYGTAGTTSAAYSTTMTGTVKSTANSLIASKVGTSTVGSATQPIYLSSGVATAGSTYAGGTKVTLNGTNCGASTASFYAPTAVGTSGYVLQSNGSGAPSWINATSSNTASTVVKRNSSGGFDAGAVNLSGNLRIGNTSNSSTTADAVGIYVRDLRAVAMGPNTLGEHTAVFYFDEAGPSGDASWKGILRIKGWEGSYAAWEIAGPATTSDTKNIYVRSGLGSTWGSWRKLLDSDNFGDYAAAKSHSHNYLPLSGGTISGNVSFSAAASGTSPTAQRITINGVSGDSSVANAPGIGFHTGNVGWASIKCVGSSFYFYDNTCTNYVPIYGSKVYGAVWNDYAEYRTGETAEAGRVVKETKDGILKITTQRLEPGCEIVSDTFGFAIGETENSKTPIAATGRVLAYPFEDRNSYELGQAVCSGPNGTISKMTREEIMMYPERIIGTVSEIPNYETWGSGNVPVNGRIWIRIR